MTRDEVIGRLAIDPDFAGRLASDPSGIATEFGISAEDLAFVQRLAPETPPGGPEVLGRRLSRSSLSFGSAVSHLLSGSHDSTAATHVGAEQQHPASPASPLGDGHDRSGPDLPQQDGPDLPQHGSQGSGTETPFRTGGPSGGGDVPTGQSGDDAPTADLSVHHDNHHLGRDGRAGYNPETDSDTDPGDKRALQPSTTTTTNAHGDTIEIRVFGEGTRMYTRMNADGSAAQEVDHPDGTSETVQVYRDRSSTVIHHDPDGNVTGVDVYGSSHRHHDDGPDGGTESSGPAVDPAWASQQHTGPGGDPEVGQEHGGPTLDPTSASKVGTGGSGTGGEGGTDAGPNPGLKPGEASTAHISDNPTGYGTASYGKVDPNPVEH